MRVFAYGSNMCHGRLRARTPSARVITIAYLPGHQLRFHKRSSDGSGKADAIATSASANVVWGVVFEIDDAEKPALDRAEGLGSGYSERPVVVIDQEGERLSATMYFADAAWINSELRPYSWYLRFVVEGGRQHGLPVQYVDALGCRSTIEDPDSSRDAKQRVISC